MQGKLYQLSNSGMGSFNFTRDCAIWQVHNLMFHVKDITSVLNLSFKISKHLSLQKMNFHDTEINPST